MGQRKNFKKTHGGFPAVVYVRREEDGGVRYFMADKDPAVLMHGIGDSAELARYTFAGHLKAEAVIKLGDDKV